jgi:protein phosphatase
MSPCETSSLPSYLEHPLEAFGYFQKAGITHVICEEKHMGSRAVMILCRNEEAAQKRFSISDGSAGIIYTRTGRHFFENRETENFILKRLGATLERSGFWEAFSTDWVCLDTELMPWSAKARSLLLEQYAPVGRSGREGLGRSIAALEEALGSAPDSAMTQNTGPQNLDLASLLKTFEYRKSCLELYTKAYRRYCKPINSAEDYRIAPFHILATEGMVWNNKNHLDHLKTTGSYISGDPMFLQTGYKTVELDDEQSIAAGVDWWIQLTESGGEGMVVKPMEFIARSKKGILQPAVKCRGREYLRIIYGPEYTGDVKMQRLRRRSLGKKRRLALAEFSLGMESLERFVRKEPLHRVHECVFAVMALENETVDPRL